MSGNSKNIHRAPPGVSAVGFLCECDDAPLIPIDIIEPSPKARKPELM